MASVTFTIPDDVKSEMKRLAWINWSELAKEESSKKLSEAAALKRALQIISKSKFSEKDADQMSDKVHRSMRARIKKEGLV